MRSFFSSLPAAGALLVLGACGGDKAPPTPAVDTTASVVPVTPADSAATPGVATAGATSGEALYVRCSACHQANGMGVPGAFPPLAVSEWVNGPASRPIAILLHGLQGEITVKGATYNSAMMPYGTSVPMSDDEVAAVLTYVRSTFGNSAPPVSASEVAKVRAATASRTTPLTQKDLEALR